MKQGKRKEYLIRLDPCIPDEREVIERLEHRRGQTVTGFFVDAVLSEKNGILHEADQQMLRQILREELSRLSVTPTSAVPA